MRGAVDAESAAAHIGAVEIEFQDLVLGQPRLQPDREKRFLDLALDGALVVEEQVLRQLLGDRRAALPHAAGLRVGHQRAHGAGDVDAEMIVEAAVLGGERRLDQVVRKILQRNRIIVLDAAAADRIAVAVEKRHREIGFLQPVVVGGFAKRRHRQRQHQDQAAEPEGRGFGQRFDEHPALPAPDIEAVHEGGEPLIEFARAFAGREQRGVDARIEVQHEMPELFLPFGWHDLAHREPLVDSQRLKRPGRAPLDVLRKCCGKPKALLRPRQPSPVSSRAQGINQWPRWRFCLKGLTRAEPGRPSSELTPCVATVTTHRSRTCQRPGNIRL